MSDSEGPQTPAAYGDSHYRLSSTSSGSMVALRRANPTGSQPDGASTPDSREGPRPPPTLSPTSSLSSRHSMGSSRSSQSKRSGPLGSPEGSSSGDECSAAKSTNRRPSDPARRRRSDSGSRGSRSLSVGEGRPMLSPSVGGPDQDL
eukprot:EG_transcript_35072